MIKKTIIAKDKKDAIKQIKEAVKNGDIDLSKGWEAAGVEVTSPAGDEIKVEVDIVDTPTDADEVDVEESAKSYNHTNIEVKKDSKREFWKSVYKASKGESDGFKKTTASSNVDSAVVEGVGEVFNEVFGGELISQLRRVPMDSNAMRLPNFYLSGTAGTTVETSGKNAVDIRDRYTKLETQCFNAYAVHTVQARMNLPALQTYVSEHLTAALQEDLDAEVISKLLAASGRYTVTGAASADGLATQKDLIDMYTRLEQRRLSNPVWLMHPSQFVNVMQFDSGVRVIADGPKMTYFGIPIQIAAGLTTPSSGASGSIVLAGLGNVAFGVQGDVMEEFNPYYGWTTNTESTRIEMFADIEPEVQSTFTRANGANSGWESSFYVTLMK